MPGTPSGVRKWTYRIEKIPSGTTEDQLIAKFSPQDAPHIQVRSLAPSINPKRSEVTATITFASQDGSPRLPECTDTSLSIDSDFYGFTPLNSPSERVVADLIAVTGLAGHAFGSWAQSSDHMWLRDELPKDLSNVAVFTYGYYSKVQDAESRNIIADHTNEFVEKFRALRTLRESQNRPHIFIGHSLGGLLIKQALCMLRPTISPDPVTVMCLIFLGTPHRGLNTAALARLVENEPSQTIINELGQDSPTLRALNDQFTRLHGQCNILSFYEQKSTPTVIKDVVWKRTGPPEIMVNYDSAVLGFAKERKVPSQADHSGIAKPDSSQAGIYPTIHGYLMQALLGNLDFGLPKQRRRKSNKIARRSSQLSVVSKDRLESRRGSNVSTASRSRYRPASISVAGIPLSSAYVDRPALMQSVEEHLIPLESDRQQILVLRGLGGSGKSQLAREFISRHRQSYSGVFWLTATSEQALKTKIALIAEQIPLPKALDGDLRLVRSEASIDRATTVVLTWLDEPDNTDWLLVFDGLDNQEPDDETLNVPSQNFDAFKYLPSGPGNIIITSRLANLGTSFGAPDLDIGGMEDDESLKLLASTSRRPLEEAGARTVVSRLAGHPLALTQAGRYMFETKKDSQQYLLEFDRNLRSSIVKRLGKREYLNGSLETAFKLSFEALKARKPEAAALLQLFGALDWSSVFWKMFSFRHPSNPDQPKNAPDPMPVGIPDLDANWLLDIGNNEDQFDDCIVALNAFSFVGRNEIFGTVSLHRLLRDWLALSWTSEDRPQFIRTAAALFTAFVTKTTEYRKQPTYWHHMMGHFDRVFALYEPQQEPSLLDYSTLLPLAGICHYRGDYARTRVLIRIMYARLDEHFGPNSVTSVQSKIELSPLGYMWMTAAENMSHLEALKADLQASKLDETTKAMLEFRISKSLTEAFLQDPSRLSDALELSTKTLKTVQELDLPRKFVDGAMLLDGKVHLQAGEYDIALQRTLAVYDSAKFRGQGGYTESRLRLQLAPITLQLGMVLARIPKTPYGEAEELLLNALRPYGFEYGAAHENTLGAAHQLNLCRLQAGNRYDSGLSGVSLRWTMVLNAIRTAVKHSVSQDNLNNNRINEEYSTLVRYISTYSEGRRKSTLSKDSMVSGAVPTHSLLSFAEYLAKKARKGVQSKSRLGRVDEKWPY